MQPIIYDVAVSVDGFICGPGGDVSAFTHDGAIVDDYMKRLETYGAVLMGRATYEFGYEFGLSPGAAPYAGKRNIVISDGISLPDGAEVEQWRADVPDRVAALREEARAPVYLCGGGDLAGQLARAGLIDVLRLKRAPILLGGGVPLFGQDGAALTLEVVSRRDYDGGALFQEFRVMGSRQ